MKTVLNCKPERPNNRTRHRIEKAIGEEFALVQWSELGVRLDAEEMVALAQSFKLTHPKIDFLILPDDPKSILLTRVIVRVFGGWPLLLYRQHDEGDFFAVDTVAAQKVKPSPKTNPIPAKGFLVLDPRQMTGNQIFSVLGLLKNEVTFRHGIKMPSGGFQSAEGLTQWVCELYESFKIDPGDYLDNLEKVLVVIPKDAVVAATLMRLFVWKIGECPRFIGIDKGGAHFVNTDIPLD